LHVPCCMLEDRMMGSPPLSRGRFSFSLPHPATSSLMSSSVNQPIKQPLIQSINQSQSLHQINQINSNQSINQSFNQSINHWHRDTCFSKGNPYSLLFHTDLILSSWEADVENGPAVSGAGIHTFPMEILTVCYSILTSS
jgi:hypothetical protein